MRDQSATDAEIAALASSQYAVVARHQLALMKDAIARRVAAGRLHPLHRGVYAVGHTVLKAEGRWMAAWELVPVGATIHVTVAGHSGRKRRAGVRVHRSRTLEARDITTRAGIPLTTRERTIADVARTTKGRRLEQLVDRAERHLDFGRLRQLAPSALQAVLSHYTVYGYEFHRAPTAFEVDRERDVLLTTRGWRVLRFTWRHITERPAWVASAIRLAWRTP
jgi:hypothetical protein